ncbi:MAG: EAL domain-containing protein [Candidatus Magnetoovum sp. WYHC-5]|nr:EAL domain-containing protein [Candidatus Magnetoovum sp. WYHC-5]
MIFSERNCRQFVECSYTGVWVVDNNYRLIYANPKMADMIGYSVGFMLGRKVFSFIDQNTALCCMQHFKGAGAHLPGAGAHFPGTGAQLPDFKNGLKQENDFHLLCQDGSILYAAATIAPLLDDSQTQRGLIISVIDTSKNRELMIHTALLELAETIISNTISIESIGEKVLKHALQITKSRDGYVCETDTQRGQIKTLSYTQVFRHRLRMLEETLLPVLSMNQVSCSCMKKGGGFYINAPDEVVLLNEAFIDIKSILVYPAYGDECLVGWILLANPAKPYSRKDIEDMKRLASFYSIVILAAKNEEALQDYRQNLEQMVKRRTEALVKINKELEEEIADRIRFEKNLQSSEHRFSKIFKESSIGMAIVDLDFNILSANNMLCQMLGYTESGLQACNKLDITNEQDIRQYVELSELLKAGQIPYYQIDKRYITKNGEEFWGRLTVSTIQDETDRALYFIEMTENITHWKAVEKEKETLLLKIEQQNALLDDVLSNTPDQIFMLDKQGKFIYVNNVYAKAIGREVGDIIGKTWQELDLYKKAMRRFDIQREIVFKNGLPITEETEFLAGEGIIKYYEYTISPVFNIEGQVEKLLTTVKDITEKREAEKRLRYMSLHDSLTGLPNRVLLYDRLSIALSHAQRQNISLAIILIDVDNFKDINDTVGHNVGDNVLSQVSIRLKECIREEDTVARISGDEFVLLVTNVNSINDIITVSDRIFKRVSDVFIIDSHELYVTVSMGICMYPSDGKDVTELVKNAEIAMYEAKASGRNNYKFFTYSMNEIALERMELLKDMRNAVIEDEFIIYYQPQINLLNNSYCGMEALLRWKHPVKEMVMPAKFIPIAEESGFINTISQWVLKRACLDTLELNRRGFTNLQVAVNISMHQFNLSIVETIRTILKQTGFNARFLELEITESIFMKNQEIVIETMHQLKNMGICISVDDFGTGYSSLTYLKHLPIDKLKIDRSFVKDLPEDRDDMAIVNTIIAMAKNLDIDIIAEGVETTAQLDLLRSMNCMKAQGFLFSKPVPLDEIIQLLEKNKR